MYNEGISHDGLLVDLGDELGIVDKSGAWYSYGETCGSVRAGRIRRRSCVRTRRSPGDRETVCSELGMTGAWPRAKRSTTTSPDD